MKRHVYHQGCLDNLCGFYAAINAIHAILPSSVSEEDADEVYSECYNNYFRDAFGAPRRKKKRFKSIAFYEANWKQVKEICDYVSSRLGKFRVVLTVEKHRSKNHKIDDLIKILKVQNYKRCYILRLDWLEKGEAMSHFVALRAGPKCNWIDSAKYYSNDAFDDLYKQRECFKVGERPRKSSKTFVSKTIISVTHR